MKVLICGSRTWDDREKIRKVIRELPFHAVVIPDVKPVPAPEVDAPRVPVTLAVPPDSSPAPDTIVFVKIPNADQVQVDVPDMNGDGKIANVERRATGRSAAVMMAGGTPEAAQEVAYEETGSTEGASEAVESAQQLDTLPDTGGASLLLPLVALLLGLSLVAYTAFRRIHS